VPGLRDSNKNKKTGIVPLENNPRCLSHEMVRFFKDKVLMEKLSKAALEDSRKYSWDRTVKESLEVVEDIGPSKKER
jgi:glycosyltransferase involved in cell wall biosynthesis